METKNQVLENAAASMPALSVERAKCNQQLREAFAAKDSVEVQMIEKQRLIKAYEGRDEACYASLQRTKVNNLGADFFL